MMCESQGQLLRPQLSLLILHRAQCLRMKCTQHRPSCRTSRIILFLSSIPKPPLTRLIGVFEVSPAHLVNICNDKEICSGPSYMSKPCI